MSNKNLHNAQKKKNDEFYTQYADIEQEVRHYTDQLAGKHVYLNCDDPGHSQFWQYFYNNFQQLQLKQLTATYYSENGQSERWDVREALHGDLSTERQPLTGNGDFKSPEALNILKEADVVISNPPFSLFRDYIDTLTEHNKDFLVIGTLNAITYKNVFPLLKENRVRAGHHFGKSMEFQVPKHHNAKNKRIDEHGNHFVKLGNCTWYTTLLVNKDTHLELTKTYTPAAYPFYDNYDAINVDRVKDIPVDYNGVMGVPITFLGKYNPNQFEILGTANSARWLNYDCITIIKGKKIYNRVLIKKKEANNE